MNTAISLTGLVAVFTMAYGFDRWTELLRVQATETFAWGPFLWLSGIANFVLAGSLLALAWFVCFRTNKRRLISVVFVIVGLLVTFASAVVFSVLSTAPPLGIAEFLWPNSRVIYASAFITAIGIVGLVQWLNPNSSVT